MSQNKNNEEDQARSDVESDQMEKLITDLRPAERVVVITGAGVSVASGIAPFRKNPNAVWENNLTERGTLRYFLEHPSEAWTWYDHRFAGLSDKELNPTHSALAELEQWCVTKGIEMTLITQNIDRLHHKAGNERLIEIHGRSDRIRCVNHGCSLASPTGSIDRHELSFDLFRAQPSDLSLPRCPKCGSLVRPHVLWFDETYDSHLDYQYTQAINALESADLIIAIGTSFSVGITELALYTAELNGAITWSIDLDRDPEIPVDGWLLGR